jgi:hypothetical protein
LVEHSTENAGVVGSIPTVATENAFSIALEAFLICVLSGWSQHHCVGGYLQQVSGIEGHRRGYLCNGLLRATAPAASFGTWCGKLPRWAGKLLPVKVLGQQLGNAVANSCGQKLNKLLLDL